MNDHTLTSDERAVIRAKAHQQGIDAAILFVERILTTRLAAADARDAAIRALADKWYEDRLNTGIDKEAAADNILAALGVQS